MDFLFATIITLVFYVSFRNTFLLVHFIDEALWPVPNQN